MDPWQEIHRRLEARDVVEKTDSNLYKAFDQLWRMHLNNDKDSSEVVHERNELTKENDDLIHRLNRQTAKLEAASAEIVRLRKYTRGQDLKIEKLNGKIDNLRTEISEKNKSIEIINDEHLVLQMSQNALKDDHQTLQKEHQSLVNRWLDKVKQDADFINQLNERT